MATDHQKDALYNCFKAWKEGEFGHYKKHWAEYYRKELDALYANHSIRGSCKLRLLEIGFGNGSFLGWARDQGHTVFGVETNEFQLSTSERAGFHTRGTLIELENAFDVRDLDGVVAFDVFEHLAPAQLTDLLQDLHRLLKPGGWILARVPNGDSPFGRLNQHGDLTHVATLGSMSLRQLALASNLQLLYTGSPQTPIFHIGVKHGIAALLSIITRGVFELPVQVLLNAYYPGNFPRWYPLSPNMVAQFAKPQVEAGKQTDQEAPLAKAKSLT